MCLGVVPGSWSVVAAEELSGCARVQEPPWWVVQEQGELWAIFRCAACVRPRRWSPLCGGGSSGVVAFAVLPGGAG